MSLAAVATSIAALITLATIACGGADPATIENANDGTLQAGSPLLDDGRTLAFDLAAAIQAGPAKRFPDQLRDESDPLPQHEVTRLWTDFLSDSFVVDASGAVTEYCRDGTGARLGTVLGFVDLPGRVFEELRTTGAFSWEVVGSDGLGEWNKPILREDHIDKSLTTPDGFLFPGWAFSTNRLSIFENKECGAIYVNPASAIVVSLWERHLQTTLTPQSPFPSELLPDSDPLSWDEVVRLWTEWRSDILMIGDAGLVLEFCSGGTGNTLDIPVYGEPLTQPEPFEWSYHSNRGHPWYEPRFVIRDTGSRIQTHSLVERPPIDEIGTGPDPHVAAHNFEHPTCGQVVPDYEKVRSGLDGINAAQAQQCARQPDAEGCG